MMEALVITGNAINDSFAASGKSVWQCSFARFAVHNELVPIRSGVDWSDGSMLLMSTIDLSNNRLYGSIPNFFSAFPRVSTLKLADNQFTGSVFCAIMLYP